MKKVANETNLASTFWDSIRWPLIIVGLLLGHVCLMMIGVTWAMANKSAFTSVENLEANVTKPLLENDLQLSDD